MDSEIAPLIFSATGLPERDCVRTLQEMGKTAILPGFARCAIMRMQAALLNAAALGISLTRNRIAKMQAAGIDTRYRKPTDVGDDAHEAPDPDDDADEDRDDGDGDRTSGNLRPQVPSPGLGGKSRWADVDDKGGGGGGAAEETQEKKETKEQKQDKKENQKAKMKKNKENKTKKESGKQKQKQKQKQNQQVAAYGAVRSRRQFR